MNDWPNRKWIPLLIVCLGALTFFTVYVQATSLNLKYMSESGQQLAKHNAVLAGRSWDPWQYRVLAEYLVEGWLRLVRWLEPPAFVFVRNPVGPTAIAFISFRLLQNFVLFLSAFLFYRLLGLGRAAALIGLVLVAWGMSNALFSSDLSFNTYFDVIYYLLAGIIILKKWDLLVIPLALVAAANRETSLLIPFMLAAARLEFKPRLRLPRKSLFIAAAAFVLQAGWYLGVRWYYGPKELLVPFGKTQGLELLLHNLTWPVAWLELTDTLSLLPLLAVVLIKRWPAVLKAYFWAVIPAWFLVHYLGGYVAETRLFLVPLALVFVPGALFGALETGQGGSHAST